MKKYLIAVLMFWAVTTQAQSPTGCIQEYRGYSIGQWEDAETAADSVRSLMTQLGLQPIGGTSIAFWTDESGGVHLRIMQALALQRCTTDPHRPEEVFSSEQLNAVLRSHGLPEAFGTRK